MKGRNVISALMKKFRVGTDRELSQTLGITAQAIQNWKNRETVTERQLAGLISSAKRAGAADLRRNAIRPLAEFFHIDKCKTKQGAKYELFDINAEDGDRRPYWAGLRKDLVEHHGVYIFFDSRGRAIYTGKARYQNLWKEMNHAFNRERGDVQSIKRVNHPTRKQAYQNSDETSRQIRDYQVPLHELASYFSAYQVDDGMIGEVEAMLVRCFANDLLNKRMERFGNHKGRKQIA
jgi:hypothetical protein